jgi:hypothetical protein
MLGRDANSSFNEPYATVNLGIARVIFTSPGAKPLTMRFDIVNLFDNIYEIRDGSGIGVRSAIRRAPRLFCRSIAENLMNRACRKIDFYVAVTWRRRYRQARRGF